MRVLFAVMSSDLSIDWGQVYAICRSVDPRNQRIAQALKAILINRLPVLLDIMFNA